MNNNSEVLPGSDGETIPRNWCSNGRVFKCNLQGNCDTNSIWSSLVPDARWRRDVERRHHCVRMVASHRRSNSDLAAGIYSTVDWNQHMRLAETWHSNFIQPDLATAFATCAGPQRSLAGKWVIKPTHLENQSINSPGLSIMHLNLANSFVASLELAHNNSALNA